MRKDLKAAFELAIEQNSIEHYKEILQSFQDELIAQEEAKKEAAATPKKSKKGKAKASDDEDVDMEDVDEAPKPKPKKRKAADEETSVSLFTWVPWQDYLRLLRKRATRPLSAPNPSKSPRLSLTRHLHPSRQTERQRQRPRKRKPQRPQSQRSRRAQTRSLTRPRKPR